MCTGDYSAAITHEMWTSNCDEQWEFCKSSILKDPCLAQYNVNHRFYLKTDFGLGGIGYVGCQPDSDPVSLAAGPALLYSRALLVFRALLSALGF
eukprot:scaffold13641_cov42-Cyclotella_meneghiniana.AAC.6